jgi:hypothetical protein
MAISGRKDNDDSNKASLEKAKANGFGQPGVAGRKKLAANDMFEDLAQERLPSLIEKSFDALERALNSTNQKTALDAYYKLHKTYYNPEQKVIVEGPDRNEVQINILNMQENMNPKELAVANAFMDLMREGLTQQEESEMIEVIDAEVIEESKEA